MSFYMTVFIKSILATIIIFVAKILMDQKYKALDLESIIHDLQSDCEVWEYKYKYLKYKSRD